MSRQAISLCILSLIYLWTLYNAARVAPLGMVKRSFSSPHRERFGEIIHTLYIKYFYEGCYPSERVEEDLQRWLGKVKAYIKGLEAGVKTLS